MHVSLSVRALIADPDRAGSLADRSRTRRRARLLQAFPDITGMTVLDLGGTCGYWQHLGIQPAHLTLLNVTGTDSPGVRMVTGDACDPPSAALDRSYDLVMCNSVIDQVGGRDRRQQLADVIRRVADRYWVQTANKGFVIDAYFLFPWFARLPVELQLAVVRHWRLTHMHTHDPTEALHRTLSIELQSRNDMRALFPDADVVTERFCGHAKSLIAIR